MRALVKKAKGVGHLGLEDMPEPTIEPDEALIRVRACGICGSDLKIEDDQHPYTPPVIVGHEFSGEIVEVGANIQGWQVGDRVVAEQHTKACGRCRQCLTGNAFACKSKRSPGYFTNGAFAEFIKIPGWLLHRIPENLNFVEGALTEPAAVAVHGMLERTGIEPEARVLVLGCGPIGLLAARMAKVAGASTVVISGIERDEKVRLPKARQLGIDHVANITNTDLAQIIEEISGGEGMDVVVELSGAISAIDQAFRLTRRLGKLAVIGQPPQDDITIPYREAMFRALKVVFSYSSKFTSWEKALSLFKRGAVQPKEFITHVLPLEEWQQGFSLLRSGEAIKVVLEP